MALALAYYAGAGLAGSDRLARQMKFVAEGPDMPSFDVVSEINHHELTNALDQTNREVSTRFDFKGSNARVERNDLQITIIAPSDFQVQQVRDILQNKLSKRGIDLACLKLEPVVVSGSEARQIVNVREGLESELARKIVKMIKESGLKLQAQIQEKQVRVTGKKRDDLQSAIALLRGAGDRIDMPLQYVNFRD